MEPPAIKRCRSNERFCEHCKQIISYKTYRAHKRLFYDPAGNKWFGSEEPSLEAPVMCDAGADLSNCDDELLEDNYESFSPADDSEESPPCSNPALSEYEASYFDNDVPQQSDNDIGPVAQ